MMNSRLCGPDTACGQQQGPPGGFCVICGGKIPSNAKKPKTSVGPTKPKEDKPTKEDK